MGQYNGNWMILKISPTLVNTLTADYVYIRRLGYFYPFLLNRLYLEKEKRYDAEIFTIRKKTKLSFIIAWFLYLKMKGSVRNMQLKIHQLMTIL